jgi:ribonuclease HII
VERGTISFIKDADAHHLPVSVASMVGKYLREIEMEAINSLLGNGARHASGYRDKVTRQFIAQTEQKRHEKGIPDRCFLRFS